MAMVLETYRASFRLQHSHLQQPFPLYDASTPNHLPFVFYLPVTVRFVHQSKEYYGTNLSPSYYHEPRGARPVFSEESLYCCLEGGFSGRLILYARPISKK